MWLFCLFLQFKYVDTNLNYSLLSFYIRLICQFSICIYFYVAKLPSRKCSPRFSMANNLLTTPGYSPRNLCMLAFVNKTYENAVYSHLYKFLTFGALITFQFRLEKDVILPWFFQSLWNTLSWLVKLTFIYAACLIWANLGLCGLEQFY